MNKEKLKAYKVGLKTRYTGLTDELADKIEGIKVKEIDLDKLTKDELNDYAVSLGLKEEVNPSMKKQDMIDIIKTKQVN